MVNLLLRILLFVLFLPILAIGASWSIITFYWAMGYAHMRHELLLLYGMIRYVEVPAPEDKPE